MRIGIDRSEVAETRWQEYAIRFVIGGLITAATGLIARKFGPVVGGLFLAYPAIFPPSATLIEKHEMEKEQEEGLPGRAGARRIASLDAAGAAMGSIGLIVFALLVWGFLASSRPWVVLTGATIAWLAVAVLTWNVRQRRRAS
jgi:hypothetical protein